jgi:hypothetical protein
MRKKIPVERHARFAFLDVLEASGIEYAFWGRG